MDLTVVGNYYFSQTVAEYAEDLMQLLRDNGYTLCKNDGNNYVIAIAITDEEES